MLSLRRILRDHERRGRSCAEIIPWLVQPSAGTVLNKDGSLLVCMRYRGLDLEGMEGAVVDRCVEQAEQALRVFEPGVVLWSTVHRRAMQVPAPQAFPDPIGARLEATHLSALAQARQFAATHTLCVLFPPPDRATGLLHRLRVDARRGGTLRAWCELLSEGGAFRRAMSALDGSLAAIEEKLEALRGSLPDIGLLRLQGDDLLAFLHGCCSPATPPAATIRSAYPAYLDALLCDNTMAVGADCIAFDGVDRRVAGALAIKGWPTQTHPGVLDELLTLPGEITLSQVFRFVSQPAAAAYMKSVQRFHLNLQKPWSSYLREALAGEESVVQESGRAVAAAQARDALAELTASDRRYGYHNFTLIAYGADRASMERTLKDAAAVLRARGFLVLRETLHLQSAWCGTLPGQWAELARWHLVHGGNLADLMPLRAIHPGASGNPHLATQTGRPCPSLTLFGTPHATPWHFNFHQHDLGHAFVLGPSRSGKSVLVNFLLSQFRRYHPVNVFIFDKDRSCRIPTVLQGGEAIDVGGVDGAVTLNPLVLLGDRNEWTWLHGWIELLLGARGHRLTSEDDHALWQAIEGVASLDPALWQLKSVHGLLPGRLREHLLPWVGDEALGRYFDNAVDSFQLSRFTCMEVGGLMGQPRLARAFMAYAWHRIERELARPDAVPTVIYIEEAWFMLEDEAFALRIRDWLKTIPKKLALVVLATQSLDDLARSAIFPTLIDNVPVRIFLPNPQAEAQRDLYRQRFGLNAAQFARIRDAVGKRQYYIVTPEASRLVDVPFSADMLACLRSDALAQRLFDAHRASGRADWRERYIEEAGRAA